MRGLLPCVVLLVGTSAAARRGAPPPDVVHGASPRADVARLDLPALDVPALLAEDAARPAPSPHRYALPLEVFVTPDTAGTWETLETGERLWRLRIHAAGATDLGFGFTRAWLPAGATLHVVSELDGSWEGPYTADDNKPHGQLWTPVVAGEAATIELLLPAKSTGSPVLELTTIGHGYRDFLGRLDRPPRPDQGGCNIDVICPQGDPWRDEIRSVAVWGLGASTDCTGTLIMDVPRTFRPWFLTANHCGITPGNAPSVVVYWNYESPSCGLLAGGSLADNQSGATYRAADPGPDFALIELDAPPDPAFDVFYSGWDASGAVPQATVGIHHPTTEEKAITFNSDPVVASDSCIGGGTPLSHWWINEYELGTTENGSSGSGLWESGTHLLVGTLSGGDAACFNPLGGDCYGRFDVAWDLGATPDRRLRDWLDPDGTGTLTAAGSNGPPGIVDAMAVDSCPLGLGDANGLLEPGESQHLEFTLSRGRPLTAVQGVLSCSTPGVSVPVSMATWADLAPGVPTPVDPPGFTVQLPEDHPCYEPVDCELTVTGAEDGPFVFAMSFDVGEIAVPDAPKPIPDPGSASSTLVAAGPAAITDVDVRVVISHPYVGDLRLQLQSPLGSLITLVSRPGGPACGDGDMDVTFDDESGNDVLASCGGGVTPWYVGDTRPSQPLSSLDGQSAAGTWTLVASDLAGGDVGTIVWWELLTTPPLDARCVACTGVGCPGRVMAVDELRVAKGAGGSVVLTFPAAPDACATGVQVRRSPTARPGVLPGSFPTDPVFADVSGEDLDPSPTAFRHVPPPANSYYLVVEALPDGSPGPSGSYGR